MPEYGNAEILAFIVELNVIFDPLELPHKIYGEAEVAHQCSESVQQQRDDELVSDIKGLNVS